MDLTNAFEALGVRDEDDEPRASASAPANGGEDHDEKTQDEIVAASKDPALYEYVRRREFGEAGHDRARARRCAGTRATPS